MARCSAIVLAILIAAARVAGADAPPSLARARIEIQTLHFEEALRTLEATRRAGGNGPRELAAILALEGEVAAGLGDADGAEASFRRLLALDPDAALPPGRAPKVIEPFEAARAYLAARAPFRAHAVRANQAITIVVDGDPLGMVAGGQLAYATAAGARAKVEARGTRSIRIAVPAGARAPLVAAPLDADGNRLVELPVAQPAAASAAATTPSPSPAIAATAPAPTERPALLARWPLWAGVAVGFGIAGAVFALDHRATQGDLDDVVAHSEEHDFAEYQSLDRRQARDAVAADVAFGIAAIAAATSAVLFLRF
jgi:hypothetical protein